MTAIFHNLITVPFYNGLILLMDLLPGFDAGVIIIAFTIIVKIILLPLSFKASKTQLQMRSTEKDLAQIKEKYKDKEEQARKTMEYYREKGINPFAGFFILIIQFPILIGLYRVFLRSGLPNINTAMLYPFIHAPQAVNMVFLHLINISDKSLLLAVIAGITTYFQVSIASGQSASGGAPQGDVARAMQTQMKYFFPILLGFIAYSISSAIALYLITSNVFAILQELYIRKKYHKAVTVV